MEISPRQNGKYWDIKYKEYLDNFILRPERVGYFIRHDPADQTKRRRFIPAQRAGKVGEESVEFGVRSLELEMEF